ncbi:MAG: LytTR family transcriptional regulator DNA-binding domain-containing protein [Bacteroidales bacterium]|nr:LytTR family transcriptional regulator DNA-binding domain-containing protein [Prolixibacteraceae bacterium]MDD4639337.1 LytTR family transcriptional regulator DNA-binding domain-containing protein [Bacteroidales bacterium]
MKKHTVYILDDEPLAIVSLKKKLESFTDIEIVGESTKMDKAALEMSTIRPDILFLDIQLAEGTGFDFLNRLEYKVKVVFVTAYDEYAIRAFEINALDYLLKPVSRKRLTEALNRINSHFGRDRFPDNNADPVKYEYSDRIFVTDKNMILFIPLDTITHICAAKDYSIIETLEGSRNIILRSMSDWEVRLPREHYVRIHRSHIVNINHIEQIIRNSTSSAKVYIKNHPEPISLSRSYYKNVRENYM